MHALARRWIRSLAGFSTQVPFLTVVFVVLLLTATSSRAGDVSYEYDANGRLHQAIDNTIYCPDGTTCSNGSSYNAVTYGYDAAGNITGITLQGKGGATFYSLSADSGPVGSSLAIEGDQFVTQAGQGVAVYFPNSLPATVTKVTVSEIDIVVPANATTGTLSVHTPKGTLTTSTFTVTQ